MRIVHTAFLIVFVAAIVIFCLQNIETVSVMYLGWSLSVSLSLLVLLVYLLGMVSGWVVLSFLRRSIRWATENKV